MSSSPRSDRGLTLIEVLVALGLLMLVVLVIYRVFVGSSQVNASSRLRLLTLKCAETEIERIAGTPYDQLPPEKHRLQAVEADDGSMECTVRLSARPLPGTVKVWLATGEPMREGYSVDYTQRSVLLSPKLDGKEVLISYAYAYPRRELVVVPEREPFTVKLGVRPVDKVTKVVATNGEAVPVAVDCESGLLTFRPGSHGKSVSVEYRGIDDRGVVTGSCLSKGLNKASMTDEGLKVLRLAEAWSEDGRKKCKLELSYVRAR